MSRVFVITHSLCDRHEPGLGHPDTAARISAVTDGLSEASAEGIGSIVDPELPPEGDVIGALKWIHDADYIDRVRTACSNAPTHVDTTDCLVGRTSWNALVAAAGLSLRTALDLAGGKFRRAFIAARPPSHHAERDRAKGYCFFNGAALASEVLARASGGPVVVVDFDAHHGNGTQRHFWERGDVGFLSVHEYPAFPGSGGADEIGEGPGRGTTRNVPLATGSDDDVVASALEYALEEIVPAIRPVALVVSAGFSGHRDDPVSGLTLTEDGFSRISRALVQASEVWSEGRILSILEGGYEPKALASSALAHLGALAYEAPVH